jgi:hypothetical protein
MQNSGASRKVVAGTVALDARAVEARLADLPSVRKVAVTINDRSEISRIDVTVDGTRDPKPLVRDIETTVRVDFGVTVNYRIISIVADPGRETPPLPSPVVVPPRLSTTSTPVLQASMSLGRPYTLEQVRVEQGRVSATGCTVTLRRGAEFFPGVATVLTPREAVESLAARATLAALQLIDERVSNVTLAGVRAILEFDDPCMVAKVVAQVGAHDTALYGIAPISNRPEVAAALAVLDATNRWLAVRDH